MKKLIKARTKINKIEKQKQKEKMNQMCLIYLKDKLMFKSTKKLKRENYKLLKWKKGHHYRSYNH